MPQITIQPSAFGRLQRHAKPFVDAPNTVVVRALDALDRLAPDQNTEQKTDLEAERRIDPRALPNLADTKALDVAIDGEPAAFPEERARVKVAGSQQADSVKAA